MTFDYKKEYKEFYLPPKKPEIIQIPKMNYIAVRGEGNPNEENGEYKEALRILYAISFTLKMSYMGDYKIDGYFPYVVPPLEGLWWNCDESSIDFHHKENFQWISMIRLPDFITEKDFNWAIKTATEKKKKDFSKAEFFTYDEGEVVQILHIGPYDNEPETITKMEEYVREQGREINLTKKRRHHEIYLSDPRKGNPSKLKTVIRIPIR